MREAACAIGKREGDECEVLDTTKIAVLAAAIVHLQAQRSAPAAARKEEDGPFKGISLDVKKGKCKFQGFHVLKSSSPWRTSKRSKFSWIPGCHLGPCTPGEWGGGGITSDPIPPARPH